MIEPTPVQPVHCAYGSFGISIPRKLDTHAPLYQQSQPNPNKPSMKAFPTSSLELQFQQPAKCYAVVLIGSPDCGAYVTASDLDRFLRSVKAGELLSSKLTEAFFTPQVHYRAVNEGTKKYGYGLWFSMDQANQVVFCELANMEDGVWETVRKVHELVIAGQLA